jgi:branched-chain amino acid aminotransferase
VLRRFFESPTFSAMSESSPPPVQQPASGSIVWRNGELLDADSLAARVSPFDHGLLTGDGVFETLIARDGVPYAQTRHYQRLLRSASAMGLEVPSQEDLSAAMQAVIDRNGYAHGTARLRITVTGGDSPLGSDRGKAQHTVLVAASPSPDFAPSVKVVTVPFARNERGALAGLKTTSYGENVVALKFARAQGAGEAIFGNTCGELCEGSSTNIFAMFGGRLITPPLSSGCLAGVTRGVVIEVCAREGVEVFEEAVPLADIENAEEAFLTSSLRNVHPIESVNGTKFSRVPGTITATLIAGFQRFADEVIDP